MSSSAASGLQRIENAGQATQDLRGVEHAQGVTGGCGVDDDRVETAGSDDPGDLDQRCELVDTRKRLPQEARDVIAVEPRPAQQNRLEEIAALRDPAAHDPRRPHLGGGQSSSRRRHDARGRFERHTEGIAQRVGGVDGKRQRLQSGPRGGNGAGGGAGGLSDATFPADEPHACLTETTPLSRARLPRTWPRCR
jgi:hypothetical protein